MTGSYPENRIKLYFENKTNKAREFQSIGLKKNKALFRWYDNVSQQTTTNFQISLSSLIISILSGGNCKFSGLKQPEKPPNFYVDH